MAAFTLQALATEINTDPTGLGYAAFVSAHDRPGLAVVMNTARAGITVKRNDVMASEVIGAVDSRDFVTTPNAAHVGFIQALLTKGAPLQFQDASGNDTNILANIRRLLVADDATHTSRAALTALATRLGSRSEQLWGTGFQVNEQNIADAGIG
jgi:hypothetical protein